MVVYSHTRKRARTIGPFPIGFALLFFLLLSTAWLTIERTRLPTDNGKERLEFYFSPSLCPFRAFHFLDLSLPSVTIRRGNRGLWERSLRRGDRILSQQELWDFKKILLAYPFDSAEEPEVDVSCLSKNHVMHRTGTRSRSKGGLYIEYIRG